MGQAMMLNSIFWGDSNLNRHVQNLEYAAVAVGECTGTGTDEWTAPAVESVSLIPILIQNCVHAILN